MQSGKKTAPYEEGIGLTEMQNNLKNAFNSEIINNTNNPFHHSIINEPMLTSTQAPIGGTSYTCKDLNL